MGLYLNFMFSPFKKNGLHEELTKDLIISSHEIFRDVKDYHLLPYTGTTLIMELLNKAPQKGVMFLLS